MKTLIVISFFLCAEIISYGIPDQPQSKNNLMIHKSKREFVQKKDRKYLKKDVEQPVQTPTKKTKKK